MSTALEDYLRQIGLSTDMLLKPSSSTTTAGSSSPRQASPTPVAGITSTVDDVTARKIEASRDPLQPIRALTDGGLEQRRQSSSVLGAQPPPPPPPKVFRPRSAAADDEDDEVSSVMTYVVAASDADSDSESRRSPTPPPLPPPLRPESIHWNPEAEKRSSPIPLDPLTQQQTQSPMTRISPSLISVGTISQKSAAVQQGNFIGGGRVLGAGAIDSSNVGSVAVVQSPSFNGDLTVPRGPSSSVFGGSRASAVSVTSSTVNRVAPLPPSSPRLDASSQVQMSSTNVGLSTDAAAKTLTRRNDAASSQFGTLTHTGPAQSTSTSVVVSNGTIARRAQSQTDASSVIVSPAAAAAVGTSSVPIPRVDAAEPASRYSACKILLSAHDDDVLTSVSTIDAHRQKFAIPEGFTPIPGVAANQPGPVPPVVPAAAATTQSYTSTIIRCSASSAPLVSRKTNQIYSSTAATSYRVDDSAFQPHHSNSSSTDTAPITATLPATRPKSYNPLQSPAAPNYVSVIRIGSTSSSVGSAADEGKINPGWSHQSAAVEPVVFKTATVASLRQPAVAQSQPSTPLGSRECVSTRLNSDDVAADRSSPCDGSVVGSLPGPVKSSLKKSAAVPAPRHVKTKSVSFSTGSVEDCNDLVTSSSEEVDGGAGAWRQCGGHVIQTNQNGGVDDFGRGRMLPPVVVNGKSIHQLPSDASPLGSRAVQSDGLHQQLQEKQQQRTGSLWNGGMRTLPAGRTRVVVTADTFQTGQRLQSGSPTPRSAAAAGRDVDPAMSATLPIPRRAPPGHIPNDVDDSRQMSTGLDDSRFRSSPAAETSTSSDRLPVGFDVMTERLAVRRSVFSNAASTDAVVSRTGSGRAVAAVAPRTASTNNHQNNNNNNNNSVDYHRRVLSIGENPGETTEDCVADVKYSNGGPMSSPRRAPLEGNSNRAPVPTIIDDGSSLQALTRSDVANQKTHIKKAAGNLPRTRNKQCKVQ